VDDQHGQSAEGDLDLNGAIDDLLGEIDSAVAESKETTPESPQADAVPNNKPADPDQAKPNAEPEDKLNADHGDEALRTIDAIEESADALLDDALDTLLDDTPPAQSEPEAVDATEPESVTEPEIPAEAQAEIQTDNTVTDDLDAAIDELIQVPVPTEQPIDEAPTEPIVENDPVMAVNRPAEEPPEQKPGNLAEEIDNAVDDILNEDDIGKEPEPAAQVVAPEPTVPATTENLGVIEDLDDALATAADDLLDGDFENAEGDLVEATTVDYAVDPSLLLDKDEPDPEPQPEDEVTTNTAPANEPVSDPAAETAAETHAPEPAASEETTEPEAVDQESVPEAPAVSAPAPSTPPAPAAPAPTPAAESPTPQPVAQPAAAAEPTVSVLAKLGQTMSPFADRAVTAAGPGGAKAILMLSSPLANKSPEVRNAVGWVALWTMFLAVVVWGYALLFSTSSPPTPTQAPSRMVEADPSPGVTLSHEP